MKPRFPLLATVIAAAVLLGWLVFADRAVPPAAAPVHPGATAAALPDAPAAVPAPVPGQSAPAAAGPAAAVSVPADVVAASEQRQTAKITRGMHTDPAGGIRIDAAPPGSVADQLHLQPGDVLKAVNNQPVSSPEDFARIYRSQGIVGEFIVIRDGREIHRR